MDNGTALDFTAQSTLGTLRLSALRGQKVVLYFYPKDNTPGCTTEAEDFRDRYADFQAANTEIIGVSRDSLDTHHRFKEKLQLPFVLIDDGDSALCQQFEVIKHKGLFGKTALGIERSTFLIDESGYLVQQWRAVKVKGHAEQVLHVCQGKP